MLHIHSLKMRFPLIWREKHEYIQNSWTNVPRRERERCFHDITGSSQSELSTTSFCSECAELVSPKFSLEEKMVHLYRTHEHIFTVSSLIQSLVPIFMLHEAGCDQAAKQFFSILLEGYWKLPAFGSLLSNSASGIQIWMLQQTEVLQEFLQGLIFIMSFL